jgi:hypothetical protein
MEKRERIPLFVWLLLSLFVCIESWRLGLGSFSLPGPGFLTFGVSLFILLSVFILFFKERGKKIVKGVAPLFRGKKVRNILYGFGVLFAYPLLLNKLGFFLCTLFFVGFCLKMIEPRKWGVVLGISIGAAFISYLLFIVWLGIQLPKGTWVNQFFSLIPNLWK